MLISKKGTIGLLVQTEHISNRKHEKEGWASASGEAGWERAMGT
jgi:hypothetical protein